MAEASPAAPSRPAPRRPFGALRRGIPNVQSALTDLGVRRFTGRVGWLAVSSFAAGGAEAGVLVLVSGLAVGAARGIGDLELGPVVLSPGAGVAVAVAMVAVRFAAGLVTARISSSLAAATLRAGRETVLRRYFNASWDAQSGERLGDVQQLLSVNAERLAHLMLSLSHGLAAAFNLAALLTVAIVVHPIAVAGVVAIGVLLSLVLRPLNRLSRAAAERQVSDNRSLSTLATEYSRLTREFRVLGVEERAVERLLANNVVTASSYRRMRLVAMLVPVVYQTVALAIVIIGLGVVVNRRFDDLSSVGAVLLIVLRSLSYGQILQSSLQQFHEIGAFLSDLRDRIGRYVPAAPPPSPIAVSRRFAIRCVGVTYSYGRDGDALHDVSFELDEGDHLGVVGRSGSGKSTLAQILLGLREPDDGSITVAGVPPSTLLGLQPSHLAVVSQDVVLFRGSISENIALFRDVSLEQTIAACMAAHIHEEIERLPSGYDTTVGEGGGAFSGGQRQRIALARALLAEPRVLVLDEPTSALDARSEALIGDSLAQLGKKVTVVLISHRLAAIRQCDKVLVLEQGRVADFGATDDVCGGAVFRSIVEHGVERSGVVERS